MPKRGGKSSKASKPIRRDEKTRVRDQNSTIDLADALDKRCTQASALASLLMETDADGAVTDTAWLLRDLVEEIRVIGRRLHRFEEK